MPAVIALVLALTGCSSLTWSCPVPVVVTLQDTRTSVRCPTTGNEVVITHPKATP